MAARRDAVAFGHMHEDHSAELRIARKLPQTRAIVIASGGDLAFALAAAGMVVTAVDSNPAQIQLVECKRRIAIDAPTEEAASAMVGKPSQRIVRIAAEYGFTGAGIQRGLCFCGRVDGFLRVIGPVIAWLHDWPRLRARGFRKAFTGILARFLPSVVKRTHGRAAGSALNAAAIALMRQRLEAAMHEPGAMQNPLLHSTLGGAFGKVPPWVWSESGIREWRAHAASITLQASTLEGTLAETADASLGLISASNLPDVLSPGQWAELESSAARTLAPGGFLVARCMLRSSLPDTAPGLEAASWEKDAYVSDASQLCKIVRVAVRKA